MTEPNGATVLFRLGAIETDVRFLQGELRKVEKHEEQINGRQGLLVAVEHLADEVSGLRKAVLTAALGLPVASLGFLLGVFALVQ